MVDRHFPLMIDSGAYSAWSRKQEVDLDAYLAFCHEVKATHPHAIFVNLDVIGDGKGSYRNWKIMRREGIEALPVYHVTTDEQWLRKYLGHTDHVGLGAIATLSEAQRSLALDRVWEDYLIDPATRMPRVKVHGMGITAWSLMRRYPWYSVDSTGWIQVGMFGHALVARRKNGQWDYTGQPLKVGFSTKGGGREERGKHFDNMTPAERTTLLHYLKENGFILGFEVPCSDGGIVRLRGVKTWHGKRCELSLLYYARFLASMPWPRPFPKQRSRGFGL